MFLLGAMMIITEISKNIFTYTDLSMPWALHLYCIIGKKYNFLIDTGLGYDSCLPFQSILDQNHKEVLIINTHFHWDHIWGNHYNDQAIILAHEKCPHLIEKSWDFCLNEYAKYAKGSIKKVLPNILFSEEIYLPEEGLRLFHTPGHTEDSISIIYEPQNALLIADNIGDNPDSSIPDLDCGLPVYKHSLEKILSFPFENVFCAHHPQTDRANIERIYNECANRM